MNYLIAHLWQVVLLGLLLVCSAFLSGTETAMFNLSRGQLYHMRTSRHALRRLAASLMEDRRGVLNTLLLANMLVNVAYAAVAAILVLELEERHCSAWVVALMAVVPLLGLITAGEVAPKALGFVLGMAWAAPAAPILAAIKRALSPVLWLLDRVLVRPLTIILAPREMGTSDITAEELAAVMDLSARRGVIGHDANALLQEIMDLTEVRAGDIMQPRVDMVAYDIHDGPEGLAEIFRRTRLRRIPVYEKGIDNIIGVVHAKRLLLNPTAKLPDLMAKVPFVPEAASVERVLLQLRVMRSQLAIVVDEYGGTAGAVTLEGVLEEIVGHIPEPHEKGREPAVVHLGDREYLLDGNLAIHEWADAFKIDLTSRRINTLGGFVTSLLGHIPRVGERVVYRNLRFTVESMRGRRIEKLRLERLEAAS